MDKSGTVRGICAGWEDDLGYPRADEAYDRYQDAIFACAKAHYESVYGEHALGSDLYTDYVWWYFTMDDLGRAPFHSGDGITLESSPVAMGLSAYRAGAPSTFGHFRGYVMYRFRFYAGKDEVRTQEAEDILEIDFGEPESTLKDLAKELGPVSLVKGEP